MDKYCRICWNTADWTRPTRNSGETQSYVAEYQYGHEEWLLDLAWPISGYRGDKTPYCYGFLQPINKYHEKYIGQTMDVCLYTVTPDKDRLFVGIIRELYVPDLEELTWARAELDRLGRFEKMAADLRRAGIDDSGVKDPPSPGSFGNVRYRAEDIEIFDPRVPVPPDHVIQRINRYQALNWDRRLPATVSTPSAPIDSEESPERNESLRRRAAIDGTEYSPEHIKLQNALYQALVQKFGKRAVAYEEDFVDLKIKSAAGTTFIEIKTAPTVKGCVRQALGQLLEYGHYSKAARARHLVVVGTAMPTGADSSYLEHLRLTYGLPLTYRRWDWATKSLATEV